MYILRWHADIRDKDKLNHESTNTNTISEFKNWCWCDTKRRTRQYVYMSWFLENCTGSAQFVQWYVYSKNEENRNNWYNKQVYHILQQDYHTYTSYIINCNCHKILSINGYAVFVIRSYLLIFFTFFIYLTQSDLLKYKFANIWKMRRKLKDMIW